MRPARAASLIAATRRIADEFVEDARQPRAASSASLTSTAARTGETSALRVWWSPGHQGGHEHRAFPAASSAVIPPARQTISVADAYSVSM